MMHYVSLADIVLDCIQAATAAAAFVFGMAALFG
jgi:hypothetical protein